MSRGLAKNRALLLVNNNNVQNHIFTKNDIIMNANNGLLRNIIPETLVVTSIPSIAYAIAMAYEAGYLSYFNVSIELVTISAINVSISIIMIMFTIIPFLFIFQGLFGIVGKTISIQKPVKEMLYRVGGLNIMALVLVAAFGLEQWRYYYMVILTALAYTLIYLVPFLFRKNRSMSFADSLETMFEHEEEKFKGSFNLLQNVLNSHGIKYQNIAILIAIIFLLIYAAYGIGIRVATEQEYFYVNKNNQEIAYLKFYSDRAISVEYSGSNSNIIKSTIIEKLPPNNRVIQFIKRKVGRLKPQDAG